MATSSARCARWLSGFVPDIPTPFGPDGAVDLRAFRRLCARQVEAGVSAIVVCETAGEASTLSAGEERALVGAAVEVAQGRALVVAGAGSNSTLQAVELTRCVAAAGADAILSVVPYYNKPMQSGIEAHFQAIAGATRLPVVLHDVPSRTNRELSDATLVRLAQSGQFVGLKDSTGDVARVSRLRTLLPNEFRLMSGDDPSALGFIAAGGDGCISSICNVAPAMCVEIFACCLRENWKTARGLYQRIAPLGAVLSKEGPPALKSVLSELGLIGASVRLPLVGPDEFVSGAISRALIGLNATDPAAVA